MAILCLIEEPISDLNDNIIIINVCMSLGLPQNASKWLYQIVWMLLACQILKSTYVIDNVAPSLWASIATAPFVVSILTVVRLNSFNTGELYPFLLVRRLVRLLDESILHRHQSSRHQSIKRLAWSSIDVYFPPS